MEEEAFLKGQVQIWPTSTEGKNTKAAASGPQAEEEEDGSHW
jgi:hypothetical protein